MTLHEVDMSQILTDAADLYAGIAEERNLRFDLRIDAGLYARGSAELLFRSACNLLDNAMKYTPVGGAVSLAARAADRDILIRSEEHTSELQSLMRISYALFRLNHHIPQPPYVTTTPNTKTQKNNCY